MKTRIISMAMMLVGGFLGGLVAVALLGVVPASAASDSVATQSLQLTDAKGQVRVTISLGSDGEPVIKLMDKGKVVRSEKLLTTEPKLRILGGEVLRGLKGKAAGEPECLVREPKIGFANR